ncbi:MAG: universal stress protein [Prochloraceae cyanobacterium]|nr:universal stress protein [Prochloraceae cyanobacterium]
MIWQKILVAVDLSTIARIAFEQSLTLAQATGASLILLHVLSADEEGSPTKWLYTVDDRFLLPDVWQIMVEEYEKEWKSFQQEGLVALEAMKKEAIQQKVNTEILQILGSPGRTICQQAKELAVDLIAIGNRGRSGVQELFLGSVSNYVIHHAACSVLIVRNPNYNKAQKN